MYFIESGKAGRTELLCGTEDLPSAGMGVPRTYEVLKIEVPQVPKVPFVTRKISALELEPSLVTFAEEGVGVIANSIPMKPVMGVPIVYMGIDGKDVPVFLDTGAKLSYLSSELTADLEKQGDAPDFHPMVGEFTVPVYDVSVSLLGIQSRLRVGNLPPMLECLVSLSGAEGILGNDLLQWGTVCIDYPGCKLGLIPSGSAGQASTEVG